MRCQLYVIGLVLALVSFACPVAAKAAPALAIINFTNQSLDDPKWQWLSKGLAEGDVFARVRKAANLPKKE